MKTIAIIKNKEDLVRIIPNNFAKEGGKIGLKICLLGRKYKTRYWSLGDNIPVTSETDNEITYHNSSANFQSACILIKENNTHKDLFTKVIDIEFDTNSPVPIPICKINFLFENKKRYNNKSKHHVIELKDTKTIKPNTIEIYFAPKGFNLNDIMHSWRCINALFLVASLDVLVQGTAKSINSFYETISKGVYPILQAFNDTNYTLIYKVYHETNSNINQISFYENRDYLAVLASTPISIKYKEGNTPIKPAYYYDIMDIQQNNPSVAFKWNNYFEELVKSIDGIKIHDAGIIIPRD